jgi:hypothetical protein
MGVSGELHTLAALFQNVEVMSCDSLLHARDVHVDSLFNIICCGTNLPWTRNHNVSGFVLITKCVTPDDDSL